MTHQVTDRELLQELAAKPIGGPDCKVELVHGQWHLNAEAREASERAKKIWLPSGKRSAADANRAAKKRCAEAQTDIEDAVAAAGGERGKTRRD